MERRHADGRRDQAPRARASSEAQRTPFFEDGCLVAEGLIDANRVDRLRAATAARPSAPPAIEPAISRQFGQLLRTAARRAPTGTLVAARAGVLADATPGLRTRVIVVLRLEAPAVAFASAPGTTLPLRPKLLPFPGVGTATPVLTDASARVRLTASPGAWAGPGSPPDPGPAPIPCPEPAPAPLPAAPAPAPPPPPPPQPGPPPPPLRACASDASQPFGASGAPSIIPAAAASTAICVNRLAFILPSPWPILSCAPVGVSCRLRVQAGSPRAPSLRESAA